MDTKPTCRIQQKAAWLQARTAGSARRRWRAVAQITVTALALVLICRMVPWRDRIHLDDGTIATVLERGATALTVRPLDAPDAALRHIPTDTAQTIEPGVSSLLANVKTGWLLACLVCVATSAVLLITRWRYLLVHNQPASPERPIQPQAGPPRLWCTVIWARSQVINLLPLSQLGGDAYRIERASHHLDGVGSSIGIVAAERLVGLLALASVAAIGLAWSSISGSDAAQGLANRGTTGAMAIGLVLGLVLIVSVVSNRMIGSVPRPSNNNHPGWWGQLLRSALSPLAQLTRTPRPKTSVL